MNHEEAWGRLPDLLDDRDDPGLLAHVRACPDCQQQLFLLGRVDRMLHDDAAAHRQERKRPAAKRLLVGAATAAAAAAALLALLLPQQPRAHEFRFWTASGRQVGEARMSKSDARNVSLALIARHLPVGDGDVFVLWAGDERTSMQVGRFMVDRTGGCRVRFNLPADHGWSRFWVKRPGHTTRVVAST